MISSVVKRSVVYFVLITVLVFFPACGSPLSSTSPLTLQSPLHSPLVTVGIEKVRFAINIPLSKGINYITGQGPAGIRLQVVDITEGGTIIGSGTIGKDNQFKIELAEPLKPGRLICIELATSKEPETWPTLWELRGENARAIPQMGYYFDCAVTE